MDAGDLTDVIKRSIIFLSEVITSGKGGQKKMVLRVLCLEDAVTVREDNGWLVERKGEDGNRILLKKFEKEPSVNQLTKVLKEYFPNVSDFVFHKED